MKDRLIKLILNTPVLKFPSGSRAQGKTYQTAQNVADHLLANGVIVPPCKVGDTLWVNWLRFKEKYETHPVTVYAFRCDTKKNNMRICVEGQFEISAYGGSYTHYYKGTFAWNSVGKTVFFTKEEAEKALAERSKE